jgi:DNA-binding winged helix-turn-helix (wHTH) protein
VTNWTFHYGDHALVAPGRRIQFTQRESDLLIPIIKNQGHVITHESLEYAAWGGSDSSVGENTNANLRVQMNHIRAKLRGTGIKIHTVWGLGVILLDPPIELDMTLR